MKAEDRSGTEYITVLKCEKPFLGHFQMCSAELTTEHEKGASFLRLLHTTSAGYATVALFRMEAEDRSGMKHVTD